MIMPAQAVRVVIAPRPLDFRRSHDSPAASAWNFPLGETEDVGRHAHQAGAHIEAAMARLEGRISQAGSEIITPMPTKNRA